MAASLLRLSLLVGLLSIYAGRSSAEKGKGICRLPAEKGLCLALIPRWCYDWEAGKCTQFNYGGCGGNANNFKTLEECEWTCGVRRPRRESGVCPKPQGAGICVERCTMDADCGPGEKCCSNGCGHVCMKVAAGP